jgi:hypothetical protein
MFLTMAELYAIDVSQLYDRKVAFMCGQNSATDGLGHIYRYDASSVLTDAPPLVIRPTYLTAHSIGTGAFIAIT